MPYTLKNYASSPEGLRSKFSPTIAKSFGIHFKNALPVVKDFPEHFERISLEHYQNTMGSGTTLYNKLKYHASITL